jgi:hypothetical protein
VLDVSHLAQYQALKNMGYSVLFVLNMEFAVHLYHIFGSLVKIVIATPDQSQHYFRSLTCARSAENPAGIPVWKIFSQVFWGSPANPLGKKWTLNPEDVSVTLLHLPLPVLRFYLLP